MNEVFAERVEETNIGYWERVLQDPTPAYTELFCAERQYLLEHIPQDANVLDLGCGEGRNMETILEKTDNVTGLDNDPAAIQDAKRKFSDKPNVRLVCGDMTELPFEENSFDSVTLLMALVNLNEGKEVALNEVNRVLKEDGIFILSVFSETALEERTEIYKRVGVSIDRVEDGKFIMEGGKIISEQFSFEEIESMVNKAGFQIEEYQKVGTLASLYSLRKVKKN